MRIHQFCFASLWRRILKPREEYECRCKIVAGNTSNFSVFELIELLRNSGKSVCSNVPHGDVCTLLFDKHFATKKSFLEGTSTFIHSSCSKISARELDSNVNKSHIRPILIRWWDASLIAISIWLISIFLKGSLLFWS